MAWRGTSGAENAGQVESGQARAVGGSGVEGAAGMRSPSGANDPRFTTAGTASDTDRGQLGGPPFSSDTPGGMGSGWFSS